MSTTNNLWRGHHPLKNITLGRVLARPFLLLAALSGPTIALGQDCLGISGGSALPGTPCDDLNYYSINDLWDANCNCAGTAVDCNWDQFGTGWPGTICDDGNPATVNDWWQYPCNCSGWCPDCDCYGVLFGTYLPGTPCDDLHPATVFDVLDANCNCGGQGNYIYGQVFLDLDQDNVFDIGEPTIPNRTVQIAPGNFSGNSGLNGSYLIVAGIGTYDVTAAPGSFDAQSGPLAPVTFAATGAADWGNNIPMWASSVQGDLSVTITATCTRPGFYNVVSVHCKNEGTAPLGGTVTLTFDPLQTFVSAFPAAAAVGNTVTWNVPVLGIGDITVFEALLDTDAATPLLTPVQHTALVQAAPPDALPANDGYVFNDVVVGAYDPNDKLVSRSELTPTEVAAGAELTYTVRFQNTGTAEAENVRLLDSLPHGLDVASFEFVGSSHPAVWSITDGVLAVLYDGILLPDSGTDQLGSNGYFMFRIPAENSLVLGDSVANSAAIYFDFNAPVITAPATFHITTGMGIADARDTNGAISLWPNPANDEAMLLCPEALSTNSQLVLHDAAGREVVRHGLQSGAQRMAFRTAQLAPGLYHFIVLEGKEVVGGGKLTVVH